MSDEQLQTNFRTGFLSDQNDEETGDMEQSKYEEEFLPSPSSSLILNDDQVKTVTIDMNEIHRPLRSGGGASHRGAETDSMIGSRTAPSILRSTINSHSSSGKPKILALHGKASNSDITRLQLANLGISSDHYDITYLNGPLYEEEGDRDVTDFVGGPFYSWYQTSVTDARFRSSFFNAIISVLMAISDLGPFDALYGFSQGAAIATFATLTFSSQLIQGAILSHEQEGLTVRRSRRKDSLFGNLLGHTNSFQESMQISFRRNSNESLNHSLKTSFTAAQSSVSELFQKDVNTLIGYMVLACPVADIETVIYASGLSGCEESKITIPTMHLIGINDPKKILSEKFGSLFMDLQVKYMAAAHEITRVVAADKSLQRSLKRNIQEHSNVIELEPPKMNPVCNISRMGLMSSVQVAHVELDYSQMHDTLIDMLSSKNKDNPLFYQARDGNEKNCTTYGEVFDFINGGDGDLRRIGVKQGEVVVYVAPPGGSAISALAFLSIMCQTTAAPLAPSLTESDTIYFLELFDAKHLILFDDVECPGLKLAFQKYSATGKAVLHRAKMNSIVEKPGLFKFTHSGDERLDQRWIRPSTSSMHMFKALSNPPDGIALLLGTSGTTNKPKGVPIRHSSLVHNSYVIASCLGLREDDTCYSIMPLFHIGGISASILCSIAAGASICCDDKSYNPESMVDALALSNPQPTWYSSVPTIHNATINFIRDMAQSSGKLQSYGIQSDGSWRKGHSLRMIRSGAAELLIRDAINLSYTYGNIPIIPTYSMSEQMPISQPPFGKLDILYDKPGSVGVPVAASIAIVDSATLSPVPYGKEGEIAICGPTVISNYLHNEDADRKGFFELTLPIDKSAQAARNRYFLTGDVGILDKDGYLTLKGRNKELIKKGGEQISPFEIEESLQQHPWVRKSVCFAVPSEIYGEEAGAAIVLSQNAPSGLKSDDLIREMRGYLQASGVNPLKWPSKWKITDEDELPKTATKKYIRVGLWKSLNINVNEPVACMSPNATRTNNAYIDWDVISGFRFILSCYVMFMHIGSNDSWGAFNNLRGWPWHVHVFFTLGGFSLGAPMNPTIEKKFKYVIARIGAMYPMYAVALVFVLVNLLVTCRPSTFRPDFHWDAQLDDLYIEGVREKGVSPLFCEGTPLTPKSYWASLLLTILIYISGSAITPIFFANWWMGYYFWFSAMYYQCLMIFPVLYNRLSRLRKNTKMLLIILVWSLISNLLILIVTWEIAKGYEGYKHYDGISGNKNPPDLQEDASAHNAAVLAWYLFSPFWMLYFAIGTVAAFLYDAFRPTEKRNSRLWGHIADSCTFLVVAWSTCLICQGDIAYTFDREYPLRPNDANNYTDTAVTNRLWDSICGRFIAPLTTLWIFALSTGEGYTASLLRNKLLIENFSPHAYNCFLFHQPICQWYYAATRNGHWWNWWRYRKTMYWFSPSPAPVEWYEYFYLVLLTVGFSALMNVTALPLVNSFVAYVSRIVGGKHDEEISTEDALIKAVEDMTGLTPELDWTLDQCGLSSVGLPQLAQRLQNAISSKHKPVAISTAALSSARTVGDISGIIREIKTKAALDGI